MVDLDSIFRPKSIAVIGASDREGTINRALFMNLILGNFQGPVFPVNPRHTYVHGVRGYKTVEEIPDPVDMAVIAVHRDAVPSIVEGCARKGVRGLVVITSGYKEIGAEGAAREDALLAQVKGHGMTMIGPNCFGVMNTEPAVSMNATFTLYEPTPGKVGFISQSGALGEILIDRAKRMSLGMTMLASIGNKAQVDGDEILDYWEDEKGIKAILLYLENIGNPREFSNLARRISRVKPIITLKAGRTARGAAAATSHTGALADQDAANQAIFEQYGIIQVNSVDWMFQVGSLLVNQPPPKGRGVAVITNGGGPGILATDALIQEGLVLPDIGEEGKRKLRKALKPEASLRNPIDIIAAGGAEEYRAALDAVYEQDDIHSVMVLFVPTIILDALEVAKAFVEFSDRWKKPLQVVWLAKGRFHAEEGEALLRQKGVPLYDMPMEAARALAHAVQYHEWRNKPAGSKVVFPVNKPAERKIIETAIAEGRSALDDTEAMDFVNLYGLATVPYRKVKSRDEVPAATEAVGYPVVLKASRPGLMHKTDVGGVELDIPDPGELAKALDRMERNLRSHNLWDGTGIMVQPKISSEGGGVECVLGIRNLEKYGPMIMFGLGGIYIEILKAVGFRMVPLTDADARDMVVTSPGWPMLAGARGRPPVDLEAIVHGILRLAQLAWENKEISEVDLNPYIVFPDGSRNVALDQVVLISKPEEKLHD
jgi:acetyl coenzyme A synthetase (ADP forming)-like protein